MRPPFLILILAATAVSAAPPCKDPPAPVPQVGQVILSKAPPLSLESALAGLREDPAALAAVAQLTADLSARMGITRSPEEIRAALANPRGVQELFSITPGQIARAFEITQAVTDAQGGANNDNNFVFPRSVDLEKAASYFTAPKWEPTEVYGPLVRYAIPSGISDAEAASRTAYGEVLDRLALNLGVPNGEDKFVVNFRGKPYTDYLDFIDALVATGHKIEVDVSNEVADFIHLMIRQEDGSLREIQTDVRLRTGLQPREAPEVIVPAVHSHFIIRMSGPDVNTAVEFYQGTGGTRFYPSVIVNGESWVGIRNSDTYTGAQALDTARLTGLYMDVLQGIAREHDQFAQGYGQSGVCNDSVAVIQLAVGVIDAPTTYPLLINKDLVGDYLERMVKERPHHAADYRRLRDAVRRMPSDRRVNSSAPGRILRSIPYEPGASTPYPGFNDARRIFGGQ